MPRIKPGTPRNLLSRLNLVGSRDSVRIGGQPALESATSSALGRQLRPHPQTSLEDKHPWSIDVAHRTDTTSLTSEKSRSVPSPGEAQCLHDLVSAGSVSDAFRMWRLSTRRTTKDRQRWARLGIQLSCKSYRMVLAEKLAHEMSSSIDDSTCLDFISAYADLRQSERLLIWTHRIFSKSITAKMANRVLSRVVLAHMWPEVQVVINKMNDLQIRVESTLLARCAAALNPSSWTMLATLLSEDGSLLNNSKFLQLVSSDPRLKLAGELRKGHLTDATKIALSSASSKQIPLCTQVLLAVDKPCQLDDALVEKLRKKVSERPERNSDYVQFMLALFKVTDRLDEFVLFAEKYKLFTSRPKVQGRLNYRNYVLMWQLIHRIYSDERTLLTSPIQNGLLRAFALYTTCNAPLRPGLLKPMLLALNTIPDLGALITLLEFAEDIVGTKISSTLMEALSGSSSVDASAAAQPTSNGLKLWNANCARICESRHVDIESVIHEAKAFRSGFNL